MCTAVMSISHEQSHLDVNANSPSASDPAVLVGQVELPTKPMFASPNYECVINTTGTHTRNGLCMGRVGLGLIGMCDKLEGEQSEPHPCCGRLEGETTSMQCTFLALSDLFVPSLFRREKWGK